MPRRDSYDNVVNLSIDYQVEDSLALYPPEDWVI